MKKFVFIFFIICCGLFFIFHKHKTIYSLLDDIESGYVDIDKYYIYGTHLNIEGKTNYFNSENSKLVLKSLKNEIEIDFNYDEGNFSISDYINDGIYLDAIPIDTYLVFFKVSSGDDVKYYSVVNNTDYNDIDYFTVTKDGKNNLINILFSEIVIMMLLLILVMVGMILVHLFLNILRQSLI